MNKQIHAFDAEHKATDAAAIKGTDIILKETINVMLNTQMLLLYKVLN